MSIKYFLVLLYFLDAVCGLFECCAMSELICNEVKNKLQHKSMPVTVAESRLVKSLCKVKLLVEMWSKQQQQQQQHILTLTQQQQKQKH